MFDIELLIKMADFKKIQEEFKDKPIGNNSCAYVALLDFMRQSGLRDYFVKTFNEHPDQKWIQTMLICAVLNQCEPVMKDFWIVFFKEDQQIGADMIQMLFQNEHFKYYNISIMECWLIPVHGTRNYPFPMQGKQNDGKIYFESKFGDKRQLVEHKLTNSNVDNQHFLVLKTSNASGKTEAGHYTYIFNSNKGQLLNILKEDNLCMGFE